MSNCLNPMTIKNTGSNLRAGAFFKVPCGRCVGCIKHKISDWSIRLNEEVKVSTSAYFITLTYKDEDLPWGYDSPTLCKRDLQLFMKRLRKRYEKKYRKLVYYAVGEYGTKKGRPHYHLLLYNADSSSLEQDITNSWTHGYSLILPLKDGGVGYVLKYMSKQYIDKKKVQNKEPEFSLMSKGIGKSYIKKMESYHLQDPANTFYFDKKMFKKPLPRYYKKKMFSDDYYALTTNYIVERIEAKQKADLRKSKLTENEYLSRTDQRKNNQKIIDRTKSVF